MCSSLPWISSSADLESLVVGDGDVIENTIDKMSGVADHIALTHCDRTLKWEKLLASDSNKWFCLSGALNVKLFREQSWLLPFRFN